MTDTDDGGSLVYDSLTVWLSDHPHASQECPDLVALAQHLAAELADCRPNDVASLAREYRMVLKDLHGLAGDDDGSEAFAASLRTAVGHSEDSGS